MRSLFTPAGRATARAASALVFANPYSDAWRRAERDLAGPEPVGAAGESSRARIGRRVAAVVDAALSRLSRPSRESAPPEDRVLLEDAALLLLFWRWEATLVALHEAPPREDGSGPAVPWFGRFAEDARAAIGACGGDLLERHPPAHLLASFYQFVVALRTIGGHIAGASPSADRLRAAVWESVFTVDLRRYRRTAYRRIDDVPTLITGPSGSGKEQVARAIGLSRYVPFDEARQRFAADPRTAFHPLNLAALSPTLIESELFGHRRGAFTGALEDRAGWLEACPAGGAVFLDEIGEIGGDIQVKLLRVIETRTFQRLGETRPRAFAGKLVAATNRDLGREMRAGRFREDLYFRLCADMVRTTPLCEILREAPAERAALVRYVAGRLVGAAEADELAAEVARVIETRLGDGYGWPGNFRELEQCVRNVLIHGDYRPPGGEAAAVRGADAEAALDAALRGCGLTADGLVRRYCGLVFRETGSVSETARRLDLDRRTVRARVARPRT